MGALKQENYSIKNTSIFNNFELQVMAEKVFKEAIDKANHKKNMDALDLAQEALVYANISQSSLRMNIHKFLGFINFDIGKYNNARIHCYQAIQVLNVRSKNYFEEKDYFEKMMALIESKIIPTHLEISK